MEPDYISIINLAHYTREKISDFENSRLITAVSDNGKRIIQDPEHFYDFVDHLRNVGEREALAYVVERIQAEPDDISSYD